MNCLGIAGLFFDYFSQQPAGGNIVLDKQTDEVILEMVLASGVDLHRKTSGFVGSQGKNTAHNGVYRKHELSSSVVLQVGHEVGQQKPHVEVEVPAVDDFALGCSYDDSAAGFDG